jgi:hypothetical protein
MKNKILPLSLALCLYTSCVAQVNPSPITTKPIPNKNLPKKEFIENTALLQSYNWWRRVNPANTIYFLSLNIVNLHNNDTSFASYAGKTIVSLVGFDNLTNAASLSGDSLAYLKPLVNLQKLLLRSDINDAGILQLSGLRNLTHLECVYTHSPASRNEYRNIQNSSMDIVGSLHKLEILRLHSCRYVTDDGLRRLSGLTNLIELDLTQWGITDNGLKSIGPMSKLETLNLTSTAITDAGIEILLSLLPNMPSFKKIMLTGTKVSENGKKRLLDSYPKIIIQ